MIPETMLNITKYDDKFSFSVSGSLPGILSVSVVFRDHMEGVIKSLEGLKLTYIGLDDCGNLKYWAELQEQYKHCTCGKVLHQDVKCSHPRPGSPIWQVVFKEKGPINA